jgi:hypothetical protein
MILFCFSLPGFGGYSSLMSGRFRAYKYLSHAMSFPKPIIHISNLCLTDLANIRYLKFIYKEIEHILFWLHIKNIIIIKKYI